MTDRVASRLSEAEKTCAPASPAKQERDRRRLEVRAHLNRMGHTITSWANANGYSRKQVYKVLAGETQGLFGVSHDIAVKLGIKDGEVGANNA